VGFRLLKKRLGCAALGPSIRSERKRKTKRFFYVGEENVEISRGTLLASEVVGCGNEGGGMFPSRGDRAGHQEKGKSLPVLLPDGEWGRGEGKPKEFPLAKGGKGWRHHAERVVPTIYR